jgi:hypothetical protein
VERRRDPCCFFSSHSPRYPQLQIMNLPKLHPEWIGALVLA